MLVRVTMEKKKIIKRAKPDEFLEPLQGHCKVSSRSSNLTHSMLY